MKIKLHSYVNIKKVVRPKRINQDKDNIIKTKRIVNLDEFSKIDQSTCHNSCQYYKNNWQSY